MELLNQITSITLTVFSVLIAFKILYYIVGFFGKKKVYPEAKKNHKYAVLISARNEEAVIGNSVDSLLNQNYPKELLTVFVVADNCDDNTANVAKEHGAIVYERHDLSKARKGYGLEFLLNNIEKDYGIQSFEAYQIFDADNLVDTNYFYEVNKVFDSGADAVYGYLHSKNYDANFISASYGMHFCRSMFGMHRPRTLLKTSTHFTGTGILIKTEYLKDGWRFHELTEDTQACAEIVAQGGRIVACEDAWFFDEQPTSFKMSFRQRLRWAKGRLVIFFKYGGKLLKGLFTQKWSRKYACYDIFFYIFPYALFTLIVGAIYPVTSTIISLMAGNPLPWFAWLKTAGIGLGSAYLTSLLEGILILIREQKHIYCSKKKQIFYLFLWPWFDLFNLPLIIACLFMRIKWKPIKHEHTENLEQVKSKRK